MLIKLEVLTNQEFFVQKLFEDKSTQEDCRTLSNFPNSRTDFFDFPNFQSIFLWVNFNRFQQQTCLLFLGAVITR